MQKHILLLLLLLSAVDTIVDAQKPCKDYGKILRNIESFMAQGKLDSASVHLRSLRACAPEEDSLAEVWNERIIKGFQLLIIQSKENEEKANKEAIRAVKKENEAKSNLAQAKRLIAHFGFGNEKAAWAYKAGKFAVIDQDGRLKGKNGFIYENPDAFLYGIARAKVNDQYVFVGENGQELTAREDYAIQIYPKVYQMGHNMYEGKSGSGVENFWVDFRKSSAENPSALITYDILRTTKYPIDFFRKDTLWGILDKKGRQLLEPQFSGIGTFQNGLYKVKKDNLWGWVDTLGFIKIQPRFDTTEFYKNGLCKVKKDGYWGWIDASGNYKIRSQFDQAGDFKNGLARVEKKDKVYFINPLGDIKITPEYDTISEFTNGLAKFRKNDLWGFIDTTGAEIIAPQYEEAGEFRYGLIRVKIDRKWCFIDRFKKVKFFTPYDEVADFYYGLARAKKGRYWAYIDTSGVEKVPLDLKLREARNLTARTISIRTGFREYLSLDSTGRYRIVKRPDLGSGQSWILKNDLIWFRQFGGKFQLVDMNERELIAPRFDEINLFDDDGIAMVKENGNWSLIDTSGIERLILNSTQRWNFTGALAPSQKNDLWGWVDTLGKEYIPCRYSFTGDFVKGLAKVNKGGKKDKNEITVGGLWGWVDTLGVERIPLKYESVSVFIDGFADVMRDSLWGFINRSGEEKIPLRYVYVESFENGLAKVNLGGKILQGGAITGGLWGWVDTTGHEPVPVRYRETGNFREGFASVKKDSLWGFVNSQGVEKIPLRYTYVEPFENGLAKVNKGGIENVYGGITGGVWGWVDSTGHERVPMLYQDAGNFQSGLANVKRDSLWGFVNRSGEEKIPPRYVHAEPFDNGLAKVNKGGIDEDGDIKGGLWGWVDSTGYERIPVIYETAGDFKEGLAPVKKDSLWGFVNSSGEEKVPPSYAYVEPFENGLAKVNKGGKEEEGEMVGGLWGWTDASGIEKIPAQYDETSNFYKGLALVKKNNLWSFIDPKGKLIIPFSFIDIVSDFSENWFVKANKGGVLDENDEVQGGQWFYFDSLGQELHIPVYDDIQDDMDGFYTATKDRKKGLLDARLKELLPCEYTEFHPVALETFITDKNGRYGLFSTKYGINIPAEYEKFGMLDEEFGWIRAKKNGLWGWVDKKGKVMIPFTFDGAMPFRDGKALVRQEPYPRFFSINKEGLMQSE